MVTGEISFVWNLRVTRGGVWPYYAGKVTRRELDRALCYFILRPV